MRIYRYISATKVEMLAAQIPAGPAAGLKGGFTIKVPTIAETRMDWAEPPATDSLYNDVKKVADYIRDNNLSGPPHENRQFIEAVMPLRSGMLRNYAAKAMFYTGVSDGTLVAMVGSTGSVIGASDDRLPENRSLDYYELRFLAEAGHLAGSEALEARREREPYDYAAAMKRALRQIPKTWRNSEFVALPIYRTPGLVVASPIFVADAPDGYASPQPVTLWQKMLRGFRLRS